MPSCFLNQPFKMVKGALKDADRSFVSFNMDSVELDAVKRSENGKSLVVRFHEYTGSCQKVKVLPGFAFASYCECNLMEKPVEERKAAEENEIVVKPYEIKTLLFDVK